MQRRANGRGQAGKWSTKPSTVAVYEGLTGQSVLYTTTSPYVGFLESIHAAGGVSVALVSAVLLVAHALFAVATIQARDRWRRK